jgi:hypothetical protein
MKPKNRAAHPTVIRIAVVAVLSACSLRAQTTWHEDTFGRTDFGKSWKPASGEWKIENGKASVRTSDYDQRFCLFFPAIIPTNTYAETSISRFRRIDT